MVSALTPSSVMLIASDSKNKLAYMQKRLEGTGVSVLTLKDLDLPQADETGSTTAENATLKSCEAAAQVDLDTVVRKVGHPVDKVVVMSEDTGLEIPSLNNWPGPYFADLTQLPGGDRDEDRGIDMVLQRLRGKKGDERKAVFTSTLAVTEVTADGVQGGPTLYTAATEGHITENRCGRDGFGFDPIFSVQDDRGRAVTFAQMSKIKRTEYNPRPKAMDQMLAVLYPKSAAAPAQPGADLDRRPHPGDAR